MFIYMFAFALSSTAPNPANRSSGLQYSNTPGLTFRLTGPSTVRAKAMYIDMKAGKGCSSCGKGHAI
jgi:hypothetical protein